MQLLADHDGVFALVTRPQLRQGQAPTVVPAAGAQEQAGMLPRPDVALVTEPEGEAGDATGAEEE